MKFWTFEIPNSNSKIWNLPICNLTRILKWFKSRITLKHNQNHKSKKIRMWFMIQICAHYCIQCIFTGKPALPAKFTAPEFFLLQIHQLASHPRVPPPQATYPFKRWFFFAFVLLRQKLNTHFIKCVFSYVLYTCVVFSVRRRVTAKIFHLFDIVDTH